MLNIQHKTQRWIAASGFASTEKAGQWLAKFNPQMWMDKTLRAEDFEIVPQSFASRKR